VFEPGWILAVVAMVSLVMSFGTGVYTWHVSRNRSQRKETDNLRRLVEDNNERRRKAEGELQDKFTRLETEFNHLPNQSQVSEMRDSINKVSGVVDGMRELLGNLGRGIERIDNHLMSRDGK